MNETLAAVQAKVAAVEELSPKAFGAMLAGAGLLLLWSAAADSRKERARLATG